MRRIVVSSLCLMLVSVSLLAAADYNVTVAIDDEGLAYVHRKWPGLTAPELRAKVGETCSAYLQREGARDITEMSERIVQKYRRLNDAQKAALRESLKTLGD